MTMQKNILGAALMPVAKTADGEVPDDEGLDLAGLLQMVMVRRKIIIGTAVAVVTLAAIIVFHMTPLYDATAQVILDQRQNKVVDVDAVLSGLPTDPTSVENQLRILRSRNLMARVIDKVHLEQEEAKPDLWDVVAGALYYINPVHWFGENVTAESKEKLEQDRRNRIIDALLDAETVTLLGRSSAMNITFRSPDAERSAMMANTIADAYVDDQLNAKFEATQKTSQWLADRLQQISSQMQAADAAVQQYKAENNITETQGGGSIVDQQMGQINGQLVIAKSELAAAQAKYAKVKALAASGRAEDVSQVFQSGMIEQLRQQQADLLRQKAQLATTFGPRHPRMLDIESQLRNIEAKIGEEVNRVVETVGNDVGVASAHVGSLTASLYQLESQSTVQNKAKIRLAELEAKSSSAHQLYEAFLAKFKETQGQEGIQTPDARVISRAVVPKSPAVPNKTLVLSVALVGGIFLGLVLAGIAERLDSGFRTVDQVEHLLGVPVLSTIPELPGVAEAKEQAADRVIERPTSSFSEAMRGLHMGLMLSMDQKPKVVLVTSSVPDEGKTTVVLALARIAARSEQKVLILDGDLRRPTIAKALHLPEPEFTLMDLLSGHATLQQCIKKDPRSSVSVLATVRAHGSPPDLMGSASMENLITSLRSDYDLIITDTAPLLPVNDTKALARLADTVVFVVRWDKTPRNAVANAARALADIKVRVAGVALARADRERYRYYAYGYQNYYRYDEYYND